jgi:hypothetical protein
MESKIELVDQQRATLGRCLARSDQWQSVELLVLLRDRIDPWADWVAFNSRWKIENVE